MQTALLSVFVGVTTATSTVSTDRLAMINEINNSPKALWTAAVNPRFEGQPLGASQPLLGVKLDSKARLDAAVKEGRVKVVGFEADSIPDEFDSATNPAWKACSKVIGDIRDQSNCGCCWAFGAAEAASDRVCIATGGNFSVPLSAQDLCFCSQSDGCNGGIPADAWSYIQQTGIVTGGQQGGGPFEGEGLCQHFTLPHCHHHGPQRNDPYPAEGKIGCLKQDSPMCKSKCDTNSTSPHSEFTKDKVIFNGDVVTYSSVKAIQTAIMTNGPVEAAFTVYSDFENYAGGIYHHLVGQQLGGHAIRIVGWGKQNLTQYWKVANSWNPYWGEDGYFRIIKGINSCGIEEQVVSSSADSIWSGSTLPPAPAPPSGCVAAMRKACGQAKAAGASICRGCCDAYSGQLSKAGCTESTEENWCNSP